MSEPKTDRGSILQLVLWPTVITFAISTLRLVLELLEVIPTSSGGALHPLGISWLGFVFGGWLALRLGRTGSCPSLRPGPVWAILVLVALIATMAVLLQGATEMEPEEVGRQFGKVGLAAAGLGVFALFIWWRVGLALLLYAIPARLTVLVFTAMSHVCEWDTHYDKFGPQGFQVETLGGVMSRAGYAQTLFWIPFTIISGMVAATCVQVVRGRKPAATAK